TNKTKITAVIGHPLDHSLSPLLHNEFYRREGIGAAMIPITHPDVAELVRIIRTIPLCLTAVTVPHKQTIISFLDEIDLTAKEIGAVNTVINKDGKLTGYNTDIVGVAYALRDVDFKGKRVLLLGAGGAAMPVAYYVREQGGELLCYNRTAEKAKELINLFGGNVITQLSQLELEPPDVIVNSTVVGMYPNIDESPLPSSLLTEHQTVFDVIYNPNETKLLCEAKAAGARAINGLSMFAAQGLEQERLWVGTEASIEEYKDFLLKK
ncbi:MAG: shikimate dehydrogenase, partial [Patescibacteria group bacterium]